MTKAIGKVWNVVSTILVAVIVLLAVLLAGVRVFGLTPYVVLSGSMEPTYHVGSLVYVEKVDYRDIQVGDPITFVLDENLTVATHRVIAISEDGEYFTTQGDANDAPDGAPVWYKNLVGRPVFTIPYLGYFSNWITNPPGMYIGFTVLAVIILMLFAPDLLKAADAADKKAEAKKKGSHEAE